MTREAKRSFQACGQCGFYVEAVLTKPTPLIFKAFAHHYQLLIFCNFQEKALLVLMSLEQWTAAYSLLSVMDPRRASLLAQAFQDFGLSPAS